MRKISSLTPEELAIVDDPNLTNRQVRDHIGIGLATVSVLRTERGHRNIKNFHPQSKPRKLGFSITPEAVIAPDEPLLPLSNHFVGFKVADDAKKFVEEWVNGRRDTVQVTEPVAPPRPVTEPVITQTKAPVVVDPIEQGGEMFEQFKRTSDSYLSKRANGAHDLVEFHIQTDAPIMLTHFSDLHIGAQGTDHTLAEKHAKLIGSTPGAYAIFGGDGIDNFIKHQSAMVDKTSNPGQEYAALEYWLSLCKFLGGVTGNHDGWTRGFAGIDYLRQLFQRRGFSYTPNRLRVVLNVNGIPYRIELRHLFRFKSSINLSNQLQRMWEFSDWNWDIGAVGHTHDGPFMFPFDRHGQRRWGALAGCYKVIDGHSEFYGFNAATPQSPSYILDHRRKDITAFDGVEKAVEYLNAIRASVTAD